MADRFYQVQWRYTCGGQTMESTYCIFGDDSVLDFTPMSAQGLADKLGGTTALTGAWRSTMVSVDSLDSVSVRELVARPGIDVPTEGSHALGLAGTRSFTGSATPLELGGIVALHTAAALRSGRGYFHLPPCRSTSSLNGSTADQFNLTDTYWTGAASLVTELGHWNQGGSAWAGGSWGMGVYSRTRRARGESLFAFHTVSFTVPNSTKWLRSRKP